MNRLSPLSSFFPLSSFLLSTLFLSVVMSACGASGENAGDEADGGALECVPVAQTENNCFDDLDDNCDGKIDCENVECAFDPSCLDDTDTIDDNCGEATYSGEPLAIPDGVGMSYETFVSIDGFADGQLLESADKFISACVVMEHSWLRDLQIEMICPSGQLVILQEFLGTTGSELHMGEPNDDDGFDPAPGVGTEYCWTGSAANEPMLNWANNNPGSSTLPAGEYQAVSPLTTLEGCTLNGDWTIRATDDWGDDNGYIFEWTVSFSTDIIPDCSDWID